MRLQILVVARKEFLHLLRDPRSLGIILFLPIFLLILFGYAVSLDVKRIPITVWDQDKTAVSRNFIAKMTSGGYFNLVGYYSSYDDLYRGLDSGEIKAAICIPINFGKDCLTQRKGSIQVLIDGTDPTIASSVQGYLASMVQEYTRDLLIKYKIFREGKTFLSLPVDVAYRIWYNENLRSLNFFIPGLICIILMMLSASLTSQTIIAEKEKGTMERLVVSPVRKHELILGKILPYVFIAFCDVLVVTTVGSLWFQVPIKGNLFVLFGSSLLFLLGALGIGLFISANAHSSQEAMMTALIISLLPTLLLTGFIFPIENMPLLLQVLSFFTPARYFLKIARGVFLKGIGLNYLWWDLLLLTVFSTIIVFVSTQSFKKRIA
ncbi:MAG: ABC transporter permease [Candidatus Margulisiibacteriota bacterium]